MRAIGRKRLSQADREKSSWWKRLTPAGRERILARMAEIDRRDLEQWKKGRPWHVVRGWDRRQAAYVSVGYAAESRHRSFKRAQETFDVYALAMGPGEFTEMTGPGNYKVRQETLFS